MSVSFATEDVQRVLSVVRQIGLSPCLRKSCNLLSLDRDGQIADWLRGPGLRMVLLFAALGAVSWLTTARIVRGQVLSLKNMEFIQAARAIGLSRRAFIFRVSFWH